MQTVDLILAAKWIVPVIPENTSYTDHALIINQGNIIDIVPQASVADHYHAIEALDLPHHLLMPGLINAHTHVGMSLLRGLADDEPLLNWLNNHIWPCEAALISADFVHDSTALGLVEMIQSGTTTFNEHYFYGDITAKITAQSGLRAGIGGLVMAVETKWAKDLDAYFDRVEAIFQTPPPSDKIHWAMAPQGTYTNTDEGLQRVKSMADQYDLDVHIHFHESKGEIEQDVRQYGKRCFERLKEAGLINARLTGAHAVHLTDEERDFCAEQGMSFVHCPSANLKLASGIMPLTDYTQQGINVALGTDGSASNNNQDMFEEMHLAAMMSKVYSQDASAMPAAEILKVATIHGAKAMGIDHLTGSLEKGKQADVIALDMRGARVEPIYNPIPHIVYACSSHQVTHSWVGGQCLMKNRKLQTLNEHDVLERSKPWQQKAMAFVKK